MRIKTEINGVTTASSYQDGDCYSLVNLRKKNGTLHPVTPRKIDLTLQDTYDIVFVHSFNDYENWIGIKNLDNGGSEVYWNINNDPKLITFNNKNSTGDTIEDQVISIQQIGNTISLITGNKILYLLYANDNYKSLGEIPEIQPIKWFNHGYHNGMYYTDEYSEVTSDTLHSATVGLFNLIRNKIYDKKEGVLIDSHLMVFAFRLYDGNYIKQTTPTLLCGNLFETAYVDFSFFNGANLTQYAFMAINSRKIYLEFDLSYLENWKDIIKSVDIFISNGLGNCSESNLKSEDDLKNVIRQIGDPDSNIYVNIMNDNSLMVKNIKEIDNFYLIDSIQIGEISKYITNGTTDNLDSVFCFPKKTILDNLDILINKETLPVDTFSHHSIIGNVSNVYNNRLHLSQIKTTFFQGFNIDFFTLPKIFLGESFFGHEYHKDLDGNLYPYYNSGIPVKDLKFNGVGFDYFPFSQLYFTNGLLIVVYLKINSEEKIVYSKCTDPIHFWFNPFFSYPDTRAYKFQIYEIISSNQFKLIRESDLSVSTTKNYSFFLQSYQEADSSTPLITIISIYPILPTDYNNFPIEIIEIPDVTPSYIEPNKLKVSALNDPFMFPNETTYLISNGIILNMASIATRISEGQFGQFPLYVFTNKGIYSMSVGSGGVVYAQEAAPTSYEVPKTIIKNNIPGTIICSTPFGVIFISARGVCIISGQDVELLTELLKQQPKELTIESNKEIDGILFNYGKETLEKYLETAQSILYDPKENEIIIYNNSPLFKWNWVLNLDSKQFHQSTEEIDMVVQNTFPDLKVIKGVKVKNYAKSGDCKAHVSLITRPLTFGTTDFKKIERMFLRSTFIDPADSLILNHYSLDEEKFLALRGIKLKPESRIDFDMGLFSRSKYRQFLFSFAGTLNEKSELKYLETEIVEEYNNTKMR
ncbi:MAG: hypothetical protein FWD60_04670 [Candidatus Azobacteroides sp.]|nr:hypothetical protein [Candidatus Azobacteroides sp.]